MSGEQLFLSELATIKRVISWVSARRGLRGADAEDFASTVKLRLIDNDYETLGRFEGRSSFKTFVAAVVNRYYLDFQRERFGKWRSSAEARRLGPTALRLESLLYRDGLTFDEACGVLETDPSVVESREELYELSRTLPARVRRQQSGECEAPERADAASVAEEEERRALGGRVSAALRTALGQLPARDRVLLRLHFEGGLSLADVARALGERQKPLYRRRDALLKTLREQLESAGVDADDARELLSRDWDAVFLDDATQTEPSREESRPRPSAPMKRVEQREGEL